MKSRKGNGVERRTKIAPFLTLVREQDRQGWLTKHTKHGYWRTVERRVSEQRPESTKNGLVLRHDPHTRTFNYLQSQYSVVLAAQLAIIHAQLLKPLPLVLNPSMEQLLTRQGPFFRQSVFSRSWLHLRRNLRQLYQEVAHGWRTTEPLLWKLRRNTGIA